MTVEIPLKAKTVNSLQRRILTWFFWSLLLLSIVTYGGNNTLALVTSGAAAFLLLPLAFLAGSPPSRTQALIWLIFTLFGIVTIWSVLQTVALPGHVFSHPIWKEVGDTLKGSFAIVTVTAGDLPLGLIKLWLPACIFVIALLLFDTDERALRAIETVAIAGAVMAILSIFQFLAFPGTVLAVDKIYYRDSLTAPFLNRNTAGTFFGVLALLLFALTWRAIRRIDMPRFLAALESHRVSHQARQLLMALFYAFAFLTVMMALFLTKSRAATGATLIAMLLLICLLTLAPDDPKAANRKSRKSGKRFLMRIASAIGMIVLLVILSIGLAGRVLQRADARGLEDSRFCVMPGIIEGIKDSWPTGAGLTSFREVFPTYRDPACGITGVWDKVHNFYIEGLFTLGIIFPVVMACAVFALLWIYVQGYRHRRRLRFVSMLGFSTFTLVALHSAVDFSLQIPGFSTFIASVTAFIATICLNRPSRAVRPAF